MIIWFAMLIPLIACVFAMKYGGKKYVWWEFLLPTVGSFMLIAAIKMCTESSQLHDVQYRGGIITQARYSEAWSTWVKKTCHETYYTGSGKNRKSHTRHYDCSYCDDHAPHWEALDDQGHTYSISEEKYNQLKKQWSATPRFVDLNRDIRTKSGLFSSCGKDGDAYTIDWDKNMLTVESSTWETPYENYVQCSRVNFGIKDVDEEMAKKYGLYEYPEVDSYHQKTLLGIDSLSYLQPAYKRGAEKMFEYFDGFYGPRRKIRVFILLFYNRSINVANKQKDYWVNGNKNEMVICIDVNKNTGEINWVYPFSWTENKRIAVDLREDISNLKTLNFTSLYKIVEESTKTFKYRDFSKFDYLSLDATIGEIWVVYILTILATIGTLIYGYKNQYEQQD